MSGENNHLSPGVSGACGKMRKGLSFINLLIHSFIQQRCLECFLCVWMVLGHRLPSLELATCKVTEVNR